MNKDKIVKVRIKHDGGFTDLQKINFPIDVYARLLEENEGGIYVNEDMFGVTCRQPDMGGLFWFESSEYELITEK